MTWKYDGHIYIRPSKNRLMNKLISPVHIPQAHPASTSDWQDALFLPGQLRPSKGFRLACRNGRGDKANLTVNWG